MRILFIFLTLLLSACSSLSFFQSTRQGSQPEPATTAATNQHQIEQKIKDVEKALHKNSTDPHTIATETVQTIQTPEPVRQYHDLWDKIVALYQFPTIRNKRIEAEKKWFLRNPDYFYRVSKRAEPFLYLIVEQIQQRNLPGELALIPIIESAFQPYAYSPSRAAGIWQFVPQTGKHFGLKQNWWYDGRRDIFAATHAALDYLQQLYQRFDNDWLLALAAYNSGGGNINKALRKVRKNNRKATFWELELNRETATYVPKLLAVAQLLADREQYADMHWYPIKNKPFLELVDSGNHIDLAIAAKLAGIRIEDIYRYNPGFNQWATDPQGPHFLLLPVTHVKQFKQNLAKTRAADLVQWRQYHIQPGDTLSTIARQHGISIATIKTANQLTSSKIRAGRILLLPVSSEHASLSPELQKRRQKILHQIHRQKKIYYRVRKGDSLWTIARKHGISYKKLARDNRISPLATLAIGQKLIIRTTAAGKYPRKQKVRRSYRVKKGDSLYTIAQRHRVSIHQLLSWNRTLKRSKYLQPGQKIIIYP